MKEVVADEILRRLQKKSKKISSYINSNDINAILHELDVFEAELLAQNEELIEKEAKLQEAKEEFEILFTNAPIVYIVLNDNYQVIRHNILADYFFNFSYLKKSKISFLSYINSKMMKEIFDYLVDENPENPSIVIECHIYRHSRLNKFKMTKKVVYYNDFKHIIISLSDIQKEYDDMESIQKLQDYKLKQQNFLLKDKDALLIQQSKMAAMGEMIGSIAHQWRQPLNNLSLSIASVIHKHENSNLSEEEIQKFKNNSQSSIVMMNATIDDFRDFFRNNDATVLVDVCDAIETSVRILDESFKYHSIQVNFRKIILPHLYAKKTELSQAILNVLSNSKDVLIQKNIEEPTINIEVSPYKTDFEIIIEDNGGGANAEDLKELCKPYFTTKKATGGTGVGLYISKLIIEKLNGTFQIENGHSGLKTTITLPLKDNNYA